MITEIKEIKKYALDNEVPIMTDDGIDFLTNFARYKRLKLYPYEKYIDSSVDGNIMHGASKRVCAKPVAKHGHSSESLWREVATRADIRTSG